MPYSSPVLQSSYQSYHDIGFIGATARLQNSFPIFDQGTTGVELTPGLGVYYDPASTEPNGSWILPAAGAENLITHIFSYDQSDITSVLATPVDNQTRTITYPSDTPNTKAMASGAIFVQLGTTPVEKGQPLQFDVATGTYLPNTFTDAVLSIIALNAGAADAVIAVRIGRIDQ